jgi:hypothetical protein
MKILINTKESPINLENNETSIALQKMLPLKITMDDLHSNEKYHYLNGKLPSNPINPKQINAGDIMLYEDNCIVIFYKSFQTSYPYTRIGRIINIDKLELALGKGKVVVEFTSKA